MTIYLEPRLKEYIDDVLKICNGRAAFVINFILDVGSITSEDLKNHGYMHGARAVGDVRDQGIPLITEKIKASDSSRKTIARYYFGSADDIKVHKFGGRMTFAPSLKKALLNRDGAKCSISNRELDPNELQIDHKVPFYIAGDNEDNRGIDNFMLLSKSMQRAKSWDCEQCPNLKVRFDPQTCKLCYWAEPNSYTHVATRIERNMHLNWDYWEVADYDAVCQISAAQGRTAQEVVKMIIRGYLGR
ncbi:hypothetical protein SN11_17050 [Vibrio harveyi]|nr:hypothetical protein SN11_17050 [Vibrio harveyi]